MESTSRGPGFDALSLIEQAVVKNARSRMLGWACFGIPGGAIAVAWWLNQSQKYGYGAMPFAVVGIIGVVVLGLAANGIIAANAERNAPRENAALTGLATGAVSMVSVDVGTVPTVSVITTGDEEKYVSVQFDWKRKDEMVELLRRFYPDLKVVAVILKRT